MVKGFKSFAVVLALLLAVATVLAACGSGSSGGQSSGGSSSSPSPSATATGGTDSGSSGGQDGGQSSDEPQRPANYPPKPITLIVPYGAGGASDTVGRFIAEHAPDFLGQTMTVVNRAGASGTIGTEETAKAKPDGYTIGLTTGTTLAVQPYLKQLNYTNADFRHLTSIVYNPLFLLVKADSPYNSVKDIIEAKNKGVTLKVGHPGVGTVNDLAHVGLFGSIGMQVTHVPFQANSETIAAILGGHVDMGAVHPAESLEFIKSGQIKVIGVFTPQRLEQFPDFPTIAEGFEEAGVDFPFKEHDFSAWYFLSVPKDVPDDIFNFLEYHLARMLNDEAFLQKAEQIGIIINAKQGDELAKILEDFERYNQEILKLSEKMPR